MKKLNTLFAVAALSVAASQASAVTTTFMGIQNPTMNPCVFGVLPCTPGGSLGAEFDWNDADGDGIGTIADLTEMRLIVNGNVFATIDADGADAATIQVFDVNVNAGSEAYDFWTTAAISPHMYFNTADATGSDTYMCQSSASYVGDNDGTCGILSSTPFATDTVVAGYTTSAVPVPAAAWLFGSAMLGLVGVGRKRRV